MALRGRAIRVISVFLIVFACLGAFEYRPVNGSALAVSVAVDSVHPNFPNVITFDLAATTVTETRRVELLYSLANEEKHYLSTPDFAPTTEIDISYALDMRTKGIPPGVEITYQWRLIGDDHSAFETEPQTFFWNDDRFDWSSVSSDQVTVHAYNHDDSFDAEILDSAQSAVNRLESDFGLEQISPVDIWVYDSNQDFVGARLTNSETWSAAVTFPELNLVLAVLPADRLSEIGRIVPHEISHQVLHQATKNPFNHPPTWLDEGLAVMNQDNGNENAEEIVQAAAADGRLIPIRSLNSSFPYDPNEVDLAYAESLSVVTFIIDHFGADKMGQLIAVYRDGISHDDAARRALGVDLDELDRLWKASLGYPESATLTLESPW
jgi:Peptidase MA superfamily